MCDNENDNLYKIRHSTAHLLAAAVLELYPDTKPTIGPVVENGFYYDFDFKDQISEDDLKKIQKKMKKLLNSWKEMIQSEKSKEEALEMYKNNEYKTELINELTENDEKLSFYKAGNFEDLCKGPHVESPSKELGHFKLMSIAGAYWRGDENNKMLTRIYGTAYETKELLKEHLDLLEEAKKRDHKKLGREMELFTFSELVGSGLPLWTPKGTVVRNILDDFVWGLRKEKGYSKVVIPHITKKDLYEKSGHWDKFSDELFKIKTREGHLFAMKPMNCPHHGQIFASGQKSYKDMPQRYCETTMVYRDEQSGELAGLSRVRSITQDDAHVFCRHNQIEEEVFAVWDIIEAFYKPFGFEMEIRFSRHDPDNFDNYKGEKETWEKAEATIKDILDKRGVKDYKDGKGEAAFYGPKIDFVSKDSLQREWQLATIQLDFSQPHSFDLHCINEESEKEEIVMLHVAIMGSIERFMSILIEHFAGKFPTWLSPNQVKIIPVSDKSLDYAEELRSKFKSAEIRVELDSENDTLGKKIRQAELEKTPYMLIVGEKEVKEKTVSIRSRDKGDLGSKDSDEFLEDLVKEIEDKK